MHCLVGLGNPGGEYAGTRHNLGFEVVDRIATRLRTGFRAGKGEFAIAESSFQSNEIVLVKPVTYMNNSGEAILDIRNRYDLPLDRFLIICDDFQLPIGQLRLRADGSDGGHNGLYSVIYHLKSNSFPRLRCGIASDHMPDDKSLMAAFVLRPFTSAERPKADEMVGRASEASLAFVVNGLAKAMNQFNQKTISP
jgi:PTH1 family peptidyl-tRNA hydrolase